MRNPFANRVAQWLGYGAFFVFCFMLFTYWTFPYDRVRDLVQRKAANQGYELTIAELRPNWLTGIKANGVFLSKHSTTGTADDKPPPTSIDELKVRVSVLPLLLSKRAFSFSAELAGGEIDGNVSLGDKTSHVEVDIDTVELKQIPALRQFTKIPVAGLVNGSIEFDVSENIEESIADIDLRIDAMTVGDGKSKAPIPGWGGLAIDKADFGTLEIVTSTDKGIVKITKFQSDGKDIKLKGSGEVKLVHPIGASRADILVKVLVEEAYKDRSKKVAGLFELAKSRPEFKKALTDDGGLQFKINGAFNGRISPQPAGKAKAPSGS